MKWIKRGLRNLLMVILLLLCAAMFYVFIIMGDAPDPQEGLEAAPTVGWEGRVEKRPRADLPLPLLPS